MQRFQHDGFNWLPFPTYESHVICKLDILMLRDGPPGRVLTDIDNRLKTIFDALKKPKGPSELGANTSEGQRVPGPDEDPFFVLVEDDSLITHVSVASDTLLEAVPDVPRDNAVRLLISAKLQPYKTTVDNADFG